MIAPPVTVERIIHMLSALEIKRYKVNLDSDMCLCKKDILTMVIRRLQHIIMLASSTRYILEDSSIQEIITQKLSKIRGSVEHTPMSIEVSYMVEKLYLDIIEKIVTRYPLITPRLLEVRKYESYLKNLENRIMKLFNMIHFVFKMTYPVCPLFNVKNPSCTSYCESECLNRKLFGLTNVVLFPADYIRLKGFEKIIYDFIIDTFTEYTSSMTFLICGTCPENIETIQHYLQDKGFSYDKILIQFDCPIELSGFESCSKKGVKLNG